MKKLILLAVCLAARGAFAASENKEFDSNGLNKVTVENTSGQVTLTAVPGSKATVTATKNKFSGNCTMTVARAGNQLLIKVEKRSSLFSSQECDVDFAVRVPKTVDLDLAIGSGNITITGIQGSLSFNTGSGDVSADGSFRKIDGKSGTGKVAVKGLMGGGELRTGSGAINLKFATNQLKGELDLKTGIGDATIVFPDLPH